MIRSTVVTALFLVFLEVLGARQHVSVLSGTVDGGKAAMFMGLLYALTFFTVVVLGPPALLTGVLLERRRTATERRTPEDDSLRRRSET
ncbi:MAG: hypothetical protein Q8S33_09560 [Myxococcales bacterium]|nr:hypothetical protein [Myxococcales bacterium]MDP3500570.1 hypothetical protein [Myxococcales bacterium]